MARFVHSDKQQEVSAVFRNARYEQRFKELQEIIEQHQRSFQYMARALAALQNQIEILRAVQCADDEGVDTVEFVQVRVH